MKKIQINVKPSNKLWTTSWNEGEGVLKMTISELSKSSKIEENTAVYVVNGNWAGYIVRDCVTDNLLLVVPIPHLKRNDVRTFEQGSTYEEVFPNNVIRIHTTEEKHSVPSLSKLVFMLLMKNLSMRLLVLAKINLLSQLVLSN